MTPRIWPQNDLDVARELAEVVLLDVALDVMTAVLRHDHPWLDADYDPDDTDELLLARRLLAASLDLRSLLARYRLAVRSAVLDEIPF
jgi:hypothetical protein